MLKAKVKVQHVGENHMKRIQAAVKKAHGSYVEVGWPEGKRYPGTDISTAEVALFNEFGTVNAPARPFMRPAIDENKQHLEEARVDAVTKVAFQGVGIEHALFELGTTAKDLIVAKINSNVPPPNAPSTLARKEAKGHGSQTLIDTGLMRDSLEVKVTLSKPLQQEKEAQIKAAEARHKKSAERAHERKQYRKDAMAKKQKLREKQQKQRTAQKAVKAQTKKAAKAVSRAGKNIKKFATKAQKSVSQNVKKAVVQVGKSVKQSVRKGAQTAAKTVKNSAGRIARARTRGPKDKG